MATYKFYVYIIYDKETNIPFYVGKGQGLRVFAHFQHAYKNPITYMHRKIAKMTNDNNMPKAVLMWCESDVEAKIQEIHYIHKFGRRDLGLGPLLNNTDGGDGVEGLVLSETHRQAIISSNKKRLRKPTSDETKQRISEACKGKKRTEEQCRNYSNANKRKPKEVYMKAALTRKLRSEKRKIDNEQRTI